MVKKVVTKKVTRKVIFQRKTVPEHSEGFISKLVTVEEISQEAEQAVPIRTKRVCIFCQSKQAPSYTDAVGLRRFLTDRGRILPKLRTNLCSKHQRRVTKQIKYARHLALLPFTPKV